MFTHLGIPKHKMNLLMFENYYKLAKTKNNLIIIYLNDFTLRYWDLEYKAGDINMTRLFNEVRKHLNEFYDLRYGKKLRTYLREIIH